MSDRNEKFRRLATNRVNNALKYIRLVGNLSNRSNYDYTEAEVKQIFTAIDEEVRDVKESFQRNLAKKDKKFNLLTGL